MTVQQRKERDRAARHRLILATARELAEAEGWDAVTTRRLAGRIEYSQPVLYSHFGGKDEIVSAVALEGAAELTEAVHRAVHAAVPDASGTAAVRALATAYLDWARENPAVYDAIFSMSTGLRFADEATPAPLRAAFEALDEVFARVAGSADSGTLTEVAWATLHGLVTLTRAGRLPAEYAPARLEVLVDRLVGAAG
ncbi:TetR family transcriptional regulator [Actinomycetospora succinea]|uniref:TetR family transcriptional regulator n=1 Tax=Actinomycetospora succinea TaxID=663603 RepID=A0A4V3D7A7_9PSEU|nr:TetR/AcrR family transcriptional regulator [Actinomycetospora succinea]TDQ46997.1 TetR family transcriptional regulator [Actinomycetospora succinea]